MRTPRRSGRAASVAGPRCPKSLFRSSPIVRRAAAHPLRARDRRFAQAGGAALGALWYTSRLAPSTLRNDNAWLDSLLKEQQKELAWLKDPMVWVPMLKGLEGNPNAKAQLLWHRGTTQGILYVKGLPPLPLGKSDERWGFVDGQPVAAGTFDARPGDATVFNISRQESVGDWPTTFAVSIEPKGGVPRPNGAIATLTTLTQGGRSWTPTGGHSSTPINTLASAELTLFRLKVPWKDGSASVSFCSV